MDNWRRFGADGQLKEVRSRWRTGGGSEQVENKRRFGAGGELEEVRSSWRTRGGSGVTGNLNSF